MGSIFIYHDATHSVTSFHDVNPCHCVTSVMVNISNMFSTSIGLMSTSPGGEGMGTWDFK